MAKTPHIVVIGAGIGGLTTAALLAKQGCRVTVFEAQTYPGGSASTFTHKGYRFESGATVAGGFQPNGPHALAGEKLGITWRVHQHEPAWVIHLPEQSVALTQDNADMLRAFPHSHRFWQQQQQIAAQGWHLSSQGLPWPPRDLAEIAQLAKVGIRNLPSDLQVVPFALMNVAQWLRLHGLHRDHAFTRLLDASLLISAQATTAHTNALYGATALDLSRQGVYHVEGGIGGIAQQLVEKIRELGGDVRYRHVVKRIQVTNRRVTGVWVSVGRKTTRETFEPADFVIANTTPWSLHALLGEDAPPSLSREVRQRKETYGAFVLHLGVQAEKLPQDTPDHHQVIASLDGSMGEGSTVFVSMSPLWDSTRAPKGQRAVTISTHTRPSDWWELLARDPVAYGERKEAYAERMIALVDSKLSGFKSAVTLKLAGTPVTYAYYTLRERGMVGGFPQTSLFHARSPRTGIVNLRLVGDSIFPGQSTAGVTLGAMRVAEDIVRHLPLVAQSSVTTLQAERG